MVDSSEVKYNLTIQSSSVTTRYVHAYIVICHVLLFVTPCTVAWQTLCPWNFSGKNNGVGCHFLHQGIFLACTTKVHTQLIQKHVHTKICIQMIIAALLMVSKIESNQGALQLSKCINTLWYICTNE